MRLRHPYTARMSLPAVLMLGLSTASWAQPLPPACTQARAGQRACMAEQACECRYERGGSMLSQPAGWRWSCSILATCEAVTPAAPPPSGLPEGMVYSPGQDTNPGYGTQSRSNGRQAPSAKSWTSPYGSQGRAGSRPYGGAYP